MTATTTTVAGLLTPGDRLSLPHPARGELTVTVAEQPARSKFAPGDVFFLARADDGRTYTVRIADTDRVTREAAS